MNATLTFPNGSELDLTVGSKGLTKLFVADGALVAVYSDKVVKFGYTPFVLEYERKGDKKKED